MAQDEAAARCSDKLVMIVDDDASVREFLDFVVKKEGFRTAEAGDGEEALRQIRGLMPDLVILDLMLPRYGGFEVLRRLQAEETARIPILIVTGRCADRTTVEMIRQESNVLDFMEKPLKPAALAMALHKILKTHPAPPAGAAGGR